MNIESLILCVREVLNAKVKQFKELSERDTSKMSFSEKLEFTQKLCVLNGATYAYEFVLALCEVKEDMDFTKAVTLLDFKAIHKAKMIGKDVVISLVERERRRDVVVEDSEGNSIDVSIEELIDARWSIKDTNHE